MGFQFHCDGCGRMHHGMPAFDAAAPLSYYVVPEAERADRCDLGSDDCVIDEEFFFVRGCLEIPVHGEDEPFSWGVWVSLSRASYEQWVACFEQAERAHIGPFFGWLNAAIQGYPDTVSLKTFVHLRDGFIRPFIELEPTDHPLAIDQRDGISVRRVAALYALVMHGAGSGEAAEPVGEAWELRLEPASAGDADALVALRIAAMRESLERIGRFDPQRARERFLSGFDPARTRHVAVDGQRIGFVVTTPRPDWLALDHLYIDPAWQGRGIGASVLDEVFREARALGLPVRVGALKQSDANRFYRRYGFELVEEGEFDLYYLRPRENGPAPQP